MLKRLLLGILIGLALASCKPPTSPPSNGQSATLTLVLPDSARALDTAIFHARYSDSIKSSWKFEWQFGDSTRATTTDTSIAHVYDSAGSYAVQVTLIDSSGKSIAKQSATLQILPLNSPTLTVTIPDTVDWGDSCVMSVQSSQPLKPGWEFKWFLGDNTILLGTNSVLHYYLTPGNYPVLIDLIDTIHNIQIASKIATVHVAARHFNLALLESMPYVSITWQSKTSTTTSGYFEAMCEPGFSYNPGPLHWTDTMFSSNYSFHTYYADSSSREIEIDSGSSSFAGNVDTKLTELTAFSIDTSSYDFLTTPNGTPFCDQTYYSVFKTSIIPFKTQSDTDLVFEATGDFTKNISFHSTFTTGLFSSDTEAISSDFSDTSADRFVTIRFHK